MSESLATINGIEKPKIIEEIKRFFGSEVKPDEMETMTLSQSEFELPDVQEILRFNPFKEPVQTEENEKFIKKDFLLVDLVFIMKNILILKTKKFIKGK